MQYPMWVRIIFFGIIFFLCFLLGSGFLVGSFLVITFFLSIVGLTDLASGMVNIATIIPGFFWNPSLTTFWADLLDMYYEVTVDVLCAYYIVYFLFFIFHLFRKDLKGGIFQQTQIKNILFIGIVVTLVTIGLLSKESGLSNFFNSSKRKPIPIVTDSFIPAQAVYLVNQPQPATLLFDPATKKTKEIAIGYELIPDGSETKAQYFYRTSSDGSYLIRDTNRTLDFASYSNPENFHTIVTNTFGGNIGIDFQLSRDNTKIAWETYRGSYSGELYLTDVASKQTKQIITYPNAEVSLVAFDNDNRQLYYYLSYGAMGPYRSEVLTFDSNNHVVSIRETNNFDFLSAFAPDFSKFYSASGGYLSGTSVSSGKEKTIFSDSNESSQIGGLYVSPTNSYLLYFNQQENGQGDLVREPYIMNTENYQTKQIGDNTLQYDYQDIISNWSPDGNNVWLDGYSDTTCGSVSLCSHMTHDIIYDTQTEENIPVITTDITNKVTFVGWLRK